MKIGDKIEAKIKRPIFNIKGNGLREIDGFIVSIKGFHYSLPLESISIELQNDSVKTLVGENLKLLKIGVTANSKQPIFSIIPLIENERQELVKQGEVNGIVTRITGSKVFFNVKKNNGEYNHLVGIPTAFIKDDMKYIEVGRDVTLRVILRGKSIGKISIDCLEDDDLSFEETDEITELLCKIKSNSTEYSGFKKRNIEIFENEISTDKTISFEHFNELSHQYPNLHFALRTLYAKSWELEGDVSGIKKVFEEVSEEVSKLRKKALITNPKEMQEILRGYKWHIYKLSEAHQQIIKDEISNIWQLTYSKEREERNKEYQRNGLLKRLKNQKEFLDTLKTELKAIPDYKTNWRASKLQKIAEVTAEIKMLETQIRML